MEEKKFVTSAEIMSIDKKNLKDKLEKEKFDKEIINKLETLLDLKSKADIVEDNIKEAGSVDEFNKLKDDFKEINDKILNLDTEIRRIYKETRNNIYSFDEIILKLKEISDLKEIEEREEDETYRKIRQN
ncbi:MAG: hypothetical protein NTW62_03435 [Candidatus Nomurabacteria bacterium]|nr:hypothetical protein [Candidatus Nomurabacteria bacterium]